MLEHRTYQATEVERHAVDALAANYAGSVSVTHDGPGETGPLRVEADGRCWFVHADGTTEEVTE